MQLLALIPLLLLGVVVYAARRDGAASSFDPGAPLSWGGQTWYAGDPESLGADAGPASADFIVELSNSVRRLFAIPAAGQAYAEPIARAEEKYGLPPSLLARQLYEESRFRPDIVSGRTRSSAGAIGIAQFMPATAAELGVDPLNPASAIDGAARYMRRLYDALGDWGAALAAYNWGIGNVQRKGLAAAPAETRRYVAAILGDVDA